MKHLKVALASIAVLLLSVGSAAGQVGVGPAFSLDDDPSAPITSPPGVIPGFGAEDPYGLGTYGGPWAPSPTLPVVPAMDAEILKPWPLGPSPMVDVAMSPSYMQPFGYVDAVSRDSDLSLFTGPLHLAFSVDRISRGIAGTAVRSEWAFDQQPGDIYRTARQFQHPVNFVPMMPMAVGYNGPLPTAWVGGSNHMVLDESLLNLTAGNGPGVLVPAGVACPPIIPGTHDNVDAVEFQAFDPNGDWNTDTWLYFSVAPDEMFLASGFTPNDIYCIPPGAPAGAAFRWANGGIEIGLSGWDWDDIDALVVWEDPNGAFGTVDFGMDYALFSLSHGSQALSTWGLAESDIFFTNFLGGFWLYAAGMDLGLMGSPGLFPGDNVDALETLYPGDANLDDCVDGLDYVTWSNNYSPGVLGNGWLQGDFNGDGLTDGLDYVVWSNNFSFGCPAAPTAVPEPATLSLLALGCAALLRRRRRA